jgi:hypothetical protein
MVSCFIDRDGKIRELKPGMVHSVMAKKWYKCKLDTAIERGVCRIRCFDSLTTSVICIDTGKHLTDKQKKSIMKIWSKCKTLVWHNNTTEKLFDLLGV